MSGNDIFIYKKNIITLEEFTKLIKALGAYSLDSIAQNSWGISQGEVVIWVYYELDSLDFYDFKDDVARDYGFEPVNEIWIELGNTGACSQLALDFCIEFAKVYNDIVVVDEIGNFYTAEDLAKLEVDKKYHWAFKKT